MYNAIKTTLAALAVTFSFGFAANAATFTVDFPTEGATDTTSQGASATDTGYFFFVGHSVTESYTDTGLSSVESLTLDLDLTYNGLRETIGLGVSVGGVQFGTIFFDPGDALGIYSFSLGGAVASGGGDDDYAVSLFVDDPVSSGAGSVRFSTTMTGGLTLEGPAIADVPLPASLPLLLVGALGLYGLRHKAA